MLTARKVPRACYSCRLQLWTLFEHGFAGNGASNIPQSRHASSLNSRPRKSAKPQLTYIRSFSAFRARNGESQSAAPNKQPSAAEIEAVVIQARQTFGNTLPHNYLSEEEYRLYERLYGPPLRETKPDDLEYLPEAEEDMTPPRRNALLRGDQHNLEEIFLNQDVTFSVVEDETTDTDQLKKEADLDHAELEAELNAIEEAARLMAIEGGGELDGIEGMPQARNKREQDIIAQLQRDMEAATAEAKAAEVAAADLREEGLEDEFDEEITEEEEWEEEDEPELEFDEEDDVYTRSGVKTHPHTIAGRSGTIPSTLFLPREQLVEPVNELLARTDWKHLTEAAEKAFGGRGLPYSTSTPRSKGVLPQKHIGLDAAQHSMSEIEADAYLAGVMPGTYSSVMSTLVEVRKRLGKDWIRNILFKQDGIGPRVLDAGAGGAGIIAWREILEAEWDVLKEEGAVNEGDAIPEGKTTVLTGASALRHRVSRFLENTTFLPRLPDYIHAMNANELRDATSTADRKSYDLIIASHALYPLKEDFRRKHMVQNLWSLLDPNGGVLILIEKGIPRGFEAIAGARNLLLERHIASPGETEYEQELQSSSDSRYAQKETGMIIAPCTNHKQCPMDPVPGFSFGRKDFCHFGQRFIRPPYLQRILGASKRNHEDVKFSYLAVRRGVDVREEFDGPIQGDAATERSFEGYEEDDLPGSEDQAGGIKFNPLSLPRAILPPLKRRGHITLDLCTPSGKLERWVVPKSFSKAAYHDARKSSWGDLWALGAKTRVPRKARIGRPTEEGGKKKGIRDGRVGKGGKKMKTNKFDLIMGEDGVLEGIEVDRTQARRERVKPQKRNKKGRVWKDEKPVSADDLG
ncbi:mitochondrial small ribosomal subunit Rsm22-domain-containing protein [Bisporella sp. PMI_857]|nr:mitochondrial small ribosomal subunit Rsm22-domain-containing protein [Bisporella sp. PMI_857]